MSVKFEDMTIAQVHARASTEGGVQRGKPLYADRPWTHVRDEMLESGVKAVRDLSRSKVRAPRAAIRQSDS
jgi:hypothetical protein